METCIFCGATVSFKKQNHFCLNPECPLWLIPQEWCQNNFCDFCINNNNCKRFAPHGKCVTYKEKYSEEDTND